MIETSYVVSDALPHSQEAEAGVIGSVLINPESYFEIARIVRAEDFYIIRFAWIWEAITNLVNRRVAIDLVTVAEELRRVGRLEEVRGAAGLTALASYVPSSLNGVDYAGIVRAHAERRLGLKLANEIASKAYDLAADFHIEEEALKVVSSARGNGKRVDPAGAAREMSELVDSPRYFTTGITDIDKKIGGLFPAELSILAGKPGTGKTAAKIQGARKNAELGARVLLVDLEMTAAQTWFRMACGDLEIPVNRIRSGHSSATEVQKVKDVARALADRYQKNLIIYQAPMTPADTLSAVMMERPDIVYVDVLKNVAGKHWKQAPAEWYDSTLSFLRIQVAQRTRCHVQVLHHISRYSSRENRKPNMADLMFAGDSDADNVFLLHREEKDYDVTPEDGNIVPIVWITDKSRFGWTGEETINYKLTTQRFWGMTQREEDR